MNEKDDMIAEAIEEEEELDIEEETEDGTLEDDEDEFERDEDGNIIIPDEIGDDEDGADEPADVEDEEEDEENEEAEEDERETEEPPADAPAGPPAPDAKDAEIARLRREIENRDRVTRDALKKLGIESEDPQAGLAKIAAEAEGVSTEEYLKRQREQQEAEEAKRIVRRARFEERMKADLARIHAAYPESKKYTSPEQFPNFKRFGELVDAGNTPEEAYIAAHPGAAAEHAASVARQSALNHSKDHLRSAVPKGSKDNAPKMTRAELESWREIFSDKNDKEIVALWRKTKSKKEN